MFFSVQKVRFGFPRKFVCTVVRKIRLLEIWFQLYGCGKMCGSEVDGWFTRTYKQLRQREVFSVKEAIVFFTWQLDRRVSVIFISTLFI